MEFKLHWARQSISKSWLLPMGSQEFLQVTEVYIKEVYGPFPWKDLEANRSDKRMNMWSK